LTISLRALEQIQLKREAPLPARTNLVFGHLTLEGGTMRFAAIADVHGNLLALEAVLKESPPWASQRS
jgi:hypothetical protein